MPIFELFYIILYFLLHSFSLVCICKMEVKPLQYYRIYKTLCLTAGVLVRTMTQL